MKVVGLVGGVAAGKSFVAGRLASFGAKVLDADRVGHEVLTEPAVIERLAAEFGPEIVGEGGAIDRKRLAGQVFGPGPEAAAAKRRLEEIVHPRIRARLREQLDTWRREGCPVAVLDAPLLFEGGWDRLCDVVWFVDAPPEDRLARALARGWSAEHFAAREDAQLDLDLKRARAHDIIANVGSAESVTTHLARRWQVLLPNSPPLPLTDDSAT